MFGQMVQKDSSLARCLTSFKASSRHWCFCSGPRFIRWGDVHTTRSLSPWWVHRHWFWSFNSIYLVDFCPKAKWFKLFALADMHYICSSHLPLRSMSCSSPYQDLSTGSLDQITKESALYDQSEDQVRTRNVAHSTYSTLTSSSHISVWVCPQTRATIWSISQVEIPGNEHTKFRKPDQFSMWWSAQTSFVNTNYFTISPLLIKMSKFNAIPWYTCRQESVPSTLWTSSERKMQRFPKHQKRNETAILSEQQRQSIVIPLWSNRNPKLFAVTCDLDWSLAFLTMKLENVSSG